MFRSRTKMLQLTVTLTACAFLLVPTILSVMAGVTANYFQGISSGLTFKWVYKVWELYADSIFLSLWLAIACLFVTLIIGLPAAYGLARHPGWLSRRCLRSSFRCRLRCRGWPWRWPCCSFTDP